MKAARDHSYKTKLDTVKHRKYPIEARRMVG